MERRHRDARWATHPGTRPWTGYALAVGATAVAALARLAIEKWAGEVPDCITFYPAVIAAALFGGTGPGLLATLGSVAADLFIIPPGGMPHPHALTLAHAADMGLFVAINIVISVVGGHLRAAYGQSRLQAEALAAAANAIAITDREGIIRWVNPAFERLTGYSATEALGQNPRLLKSGKHDRAFFEKMWETIQAGHVWRGELVNKRKDGTLYDGEMTITPVQDPRGVITHFIAVKQDATERKRAEAALGEQAQLAHLRADATQALQQPAAIRELLQKVAALLVERLNAAFARVWTLDPTGRTLELQASAGLYTHLDGAHSRVPVGQLKIGRIAQERRPLVTNQVIGDPHVPDQDWARREGLVAFAGMPLLVEGQPLGVLALFARHPLSPAAVETLGILAGALAQALSRHRAEEALRAAREGLVAANADLERKVQERTAKLRQTIEELEGFSYSIVHDMRAPLRAMQNFAALAQESCAGCGRTDGLDYFRRIRTASNRMDLLITDALNYTKVVRQELAMTSVDVGRLLRGIVETYLNLQPPAVEIQVEFEALLVLGNESVLTQVFSNLLGNAVKFVAPAVKPCVRVWAETRAGCPGGPGFDSVRNEESDREQFVRIWVEDNGIGIPKGAHSKIFGMFRRMHGAEEYPGTGIGLAIVRKAMERTGGRVGVESEPGQGSRFWIELCQAKQERPSAESGTSNEAGPDRKALAVGLAELTSNK